MPESAGDVSPTLTIQTSYSAKVVIEVTAGPHQGARFDFSRPATLLAGRSSSAQLRLNRDPYFSRHHFRLEINPPKCYLLDLGSSNGTFVNDRRVRGQHLQDGDIISGGDTQLRVSVEEVRGRPRGAESANSPSTKGILDQDAEPGCDGTESRSTPEPPRVPGYEVLEFLGRGKMGVVYRALKSATGKETALKLIVPEQAATREGLQLFVREASILSQLNHAGIVRLREFGLANERPFLAMEYVQAEDFGVILRKADEPARVRMSCGIVCQILEAIAHAHSRNLVHRDIKPGNVLVTRVDRRLRAKLADFGFAKNYVDAGFSGVTAEGQVCGTLAYMPPEQIIDCRHAKPSCDIYATGATLYHYLSGGPPFRVSNSGSSLAIILEQDPQPLSALCPTLPERLVEVVHRALAKRPRNRFHSAEEMRRELVPFARRMMD